MTNLTRFTTSIRFKLIKSSYSHWLKKGDKILDVGCGNGIITKLVKNNFEVKIIGADIENYLIYDLPFIKIEGNSLLSIKNKFDVLMLNDVLHHLSKDEQEKLIVEALSLAKKVLIFEAEPTLAGKIADIILNKFHYNKLNVPLSFREVNDWIKIFKKLNLNYQLIKPKKPFWYPFSHIAFLLRIHHIQ